MWPRHVDMTPAECAAKLRRLELDAYSGVVSALRAQGDLTKERRKVLADLSSTLNMSVERHKAEVRRAFNDEMLATIARCVSGSNCENDWARECRRIIPLMRRATPSTAIALGADEAAGAAAARNGALPVPARTRTPRPPAAAKPGEKGDRLPPLKDILCERDGVARARQPGVAVVARGGKWRLPKHPNELGDVVILPSGMAVRFKEESLVREQFIKAEPNSQSASEESSSEVARATPKRRRRKRKGQQDAPPDVRGSYEFLPPGSLFPSHSHPFAAPAVGSMGPPPPPPPPPPGLANAGGTPGSGGASVPRRGTPRPPPKRRRSRSKPANKPTGEASLSSASLTTSSFASTPSSTLHGYARPFLPTAPSPMHKLEGLQQRASPGGEASSGGVSGPVEQKMSSAAAPAPPPQLPRVPVSPQKITQAMQRAAAAAAAAVSGAKVGGNEPKTSLSDTATSTTAVIKQLLPRSPVSSTTLAAPAPGTPVYMVASPSSSSAGTATSGVRTLVTTSPSAAAAVTAGGVAQRVVTVSAAALKAAQQQQQQHQQQKTTTVYRTLAPGQRTFLAGSPTTPGGSIVGTAGSAGAGTPGRPSVIVVQRTPVTSKALTGSTAAPHVPGGSAILTGASGQRILAAKGGKPLVILSKPAAGIIPGAPGSAPIFLTATPPSTAAGVVTVGTSEVNTDTDSGDKSASSRLTSQDVNQDDKDENGGEGRIGGPIGAGSNVLSDVQQTTGILLHRQQLASPDPPLPLASAGVLDQEEQVEMTATVEDGGVERVAEVAAGGEENSTTTVVMVDAVEEEEEEESQKAHAQDSNNFHHQSEEVAQVKLKALPEAAGGDHDVPMEEDENASNSFTQEQRQLEPRLAVVAGSGTAATAATATATTTTYLKTKARLSNKETVLPPCAAPADVMPMAAFAAVGPSPATAPPPVTASTAATTTTTTGTSAVTMKNGSSPTGELEEEEEEPGESLEDISEFIRDTSKANATQLNSQ